MGVSKRNAELDVLRCLAMFLIVTGHAYHYGPFYHASNWLDIIFWSIICWHVDAFLALSGWFGVKFSIRKFCALYGVVVFYSVLSFIVGRFCLGTPVPFRITGGWYGNTYLCLMLLAPLLNKGIQGLVDNGSRTAWLAWIGFAFIIWLNWLGGSVYVGLVAYDIKPFTLVQMVFVYFTVRLVRLTNVADKVSFWQLAAVITGFAFSVCVMPNDRTNYIAPYTIAMATAMLLLFAKFVKFPNWLCKCCIAIAPLMFGVYLCHETTSFGRALYRVPIKFTYGHVSTTPLVSILIGACFCFIICIAIEATRKMAAHIFVRILKSSFTKTEE